MAQVSKDEFYSRFASMKLGELQAVAAAEGHTLAASKRSDAVDELWSVYTGKVAPSDAEPATAALAAASMPWEARLIDVRRDQYKRAGYSFSRRWEVLKPQPGAAQLETLKADRAIQVRLKG